MHYMAHGLTRKKLRWLGQPLAVIFAVLCICGGITGGNNHHMIEAMFKAFAKALDEATIIDPRITDILSTKGSL